MGVTSHPPGVEVLRGRVWLAVGASSSRVRKMIAVLVCVTPVALEEPGSVVPAGQLGAASVGCWAEGKEPGLLFPARWERFPGCVSYQRRSGELKASDPWLASC